jgi:hypothetical protein
MERAIRRLLSKKSRPVLVHACQGLHAGQIRAKYGFSHLWDLKDTQYVCFVFTGRLAEAFPASNAETNVLFCHCQLCLQLPRIVRTGD